MIDFKNLSLASRQVATQSAMNPILWKSAICSPIALICSLWASPPLSYFMFGLACIPIIVGSIIYAYFAFRDPDRLQSERHIQNMTVLSRMGGQTDEGPVEITLPSNTPLLNNPELDGESK